MFCAPVEFVIVRMSAVPAVTVPRPVADGSQRKRQPPGLIGPIFGVVPRPAQQGRHGAVVDDDVREAEQPETLHTDEARVARAGADDTDVSCGHH